MRIVVAESIKDARRCGFTQNSSVVITPRNFRICGRGVEATGLFVTPAVMAHPRLPSILHAIYPCFNRADVRLRDQLDNLIGGEPEW